MARPFTVLELIPELQFWIKSPTDPSLRKLLRRTIQTLEAFNALHAEVNRKFTDLVGEPEIGDSRAPEVAATLPDLPTRIKDSE
jgi:hypothetical protein